MARSKSLVKSVDIERPCRVMFPASATFTLELCRAFGDCHVTQSTHWHIATSFIHCQYEVYIHASDFDRFINLCSIEAKRIGLDKYTAILGGLVMRVEVKPYALGK